MMNILLGIGNEMHGDDGIGIYIARKLHHKNWISIDCLTVPENYSGEIARLKPEKVVIIDAADMGLKPGEIRRIPKDKIGRASFSTHSIPISLFISHLEQLTKAQIYLIGIQPKSMYGTIHNKVMGSAEKILTYVEEDKLEEIDELK